MDRKVKIKNETYSLQEIKINYDKNEFRIPKYQRGYVWDSKRRGKLIDSLLRGYPIGSIIVWRNNNYKYVLDGQQRTRSLLQIREYPFKDMQLSTFNDLFNERYLEKNGSFVENVFNHLKDKSIDELYVKPYDDKAKDYIKEYVSKNRTEAEIVGIDVDEIIRTLKEYVGMLYTGESFVIPSIDISEAPEEDAIEIFDRLNSQGIELTRMEKLAARWSSQIIEIKNEELLMIIENIYKADKSSDIRDVEENTPAEIIWAILLNSFAHTTFFKSLFVEKVRGVEVLKHKHVDKLLWLIRIMVAKYNGADINDDLNNYLNDSFESDIGLGIEIAKIANDEEWLIDAAEMMSQAWMKIESLCPILKKEHNEKYIFASAAPTNLFVSMASQVFWRLLENSDATINDTLQLVLVKEIINGSYESSTNTEVKNTILSEEYMNKLSLGDVKKKLKEVNGLQKEEINFKRGFSNVVKLVISISYAGYANNKINRFDFDHIFPKNWLKKHNLSRGQNSIGNCGVLQDSENRSKQDSVITSELLSDKLFKIHDMDETKYKSEIENIKVYKKHDDFVRYMDNRFEIISEKFLENINPFVID